MELSKRLLLINQHPKPVWVLNIISAFQRKIRMKVRLGFRAAGRHLAVMLRSEFEHFIKECPHRP